MPPVMQAIVSLSPPIEIASRTAFSKSTLSKKAIIASGTDPWQISLNLVPAYRHQYFARHAYTGQTLQLCYYIVRKVCILGNLF
jgi:hypothetical protein